MKQETIELGMELLKEVNELKLYPEIIKNVHFEMVGSCEFSNDRAVICIPTRFTKKLLEEVKKIIVELEKEIELL